MIIELAYATNRLPSEWAKEDPIDIESMIKFMQDRQREQDSANRVRSR